MLVCTLKTYQSKTCDFHFKSSCCSWSAIFSPECLEGARVGKSVLRFQCSVNAHPPWAHKPAYTRVTHKAQCSEIPRFLVGEFLVNWATDLEEKVVKRKVIITKSSVMELFAPTAKRLGLSSQSQSQSWRLWTLHSFPLSFFQSSGNALCVRSIPSDTLGESTYLFL